MRSIFIVSLVLFAMGVFPGCKKDEPLFRKIDSEHSGIHFRNDLVPSVDFNIFNYMYFYNGGGVGVGDLNGDSLLDIYFTANQQPNRLYLNKGELKFDDVTDISGVSGFKGWSTGVTIADVNGDGRLDIYVSYLGDYLVQKSRNQLFINEGNNADGVPLFVDRAMEFGLDLVGFSTQAAFFDYDLDGDLDMYMLNHSVHQNGTFGKATLRAKQHQLSGDKLLRNENGRFIDVTAESGIYSSVIGYGLGVTVGDVDLDGWPDIYIGNDFHENDYLYINQRDGTFKESLEAQMNHTSRYTMGVDLADFNNDVFPDLIAMDMLPADQKILKSSASEDPFDVYDFKISYGYNHQFSRNSLQLNNGNNTFSEVGLFANVSATDWSWATFFADFDLDGRKDIFVSNGINRRTNDLDYINFISVDSIQMKMKFQMGEKELSYINYMPEIKLPNYLYINAGDTTFIDRSREAGFTDPSYSNGAAYGDFDNDGDIDLVVNNIDDEAFLFENTTRSNDKDSSRPFVQFHLKGERLNTFGIGTKVLLYVGHTVQMQECMPTRGFQSSVDYRLTFGVGDAGLIDSAVVIWPGGATERLRNLKVNSVFIVNEKNASGRFDFDRLHISKHLFQHVVSEIPYAHRENKFVEFNREGLIPHMFSAEGPAVAVGDVNNDGLEDVFLGGAKRIPASLLIQTQDGGFRNDVTEIIQSDSVFEDVAAVFIDANNDGWQDLFVLSGGNEFSLRSPYSSPRLYVNDGTGRLSAKTELPGVVLTGSCIAANDYDNDGDIDLFLGARTIPWNYGVLPDSYLLQNDGKGNFSDVTDSVSPALKKVGFVKDAIWADMDGDKTKDLVVVGEWFPISVFVNKNGHLQQMNTLTSGLEKSNGWWNCVEVIDMDGDGDNDLIAGNLGLNSKLRASIDQPVRMYVNDFDSNDSIEQIVTHMVNGKEYPFATRDEMIKQIPKLKKNFLSYKKFSESTFENFFSEAELNGAKEYEVFEFRTSLVENLGNGKFAIRPLPKSVQISTVNAIMVDDFNKDGFKDVMLGGNFYPINIQMGRYDASYGHVLIGRKDGSFEVLPSSVSGVSIDGEIRRFAKIKTKDAEFYWAVRNNDSLKVIKLKSP